MKLPLNEGWFFTPAWTPALLTATDGTGLSPVRLPHTVKELPLNYFDEAAYQLESGYLRFLDALESWRGKCVELTFGAAGHEAEVFCNEVAAKVAVEAFEDTLGVFVGCDERMVVACVAYYDVRLG